MPRWNEPPKSGDVVRYQSALQNDPNGIIYGWPQLRSITQDQQLVAQDGLLAIGCDADRVIRLPPLGSMEPGQALLLSTTQLGGFSCTVEAHISDQVGLAPYPIEYLFNGFVCPFNVSFTIRRVDDPFTGRPVWRIECKQVWGAGPEGVLLPFASGYQLVEDNQQGTELVVALPFDPVLWETGIPCFASPPLYDNPVPGSLSIAEAAQGLFKIEFYASFAVRDTGVLVDAEVRYNGASWPIPGQLHVTDTPDDDGIENMACHAIVPIMAPLFPVWPTILQLFFSASAPTVITLYQVGLSVLRP